MVTFYPSHLAVVADTGRRRGDAWRGRRRGEDAVVQELAAQEVEVSPCPEQRMDIQPLAGMRGKQLGDRKSVAICCFCRDCGLHVGRVWGWLRFGVWPTSFANKVSVQCQALSYVMHGMNQLLSKAERGRTPLKPIPPLSLTFCLWWRALPILRTLRLRGDCGNMQRYTYCSIG